MSASSGAASLLTLPALPELRFVAVSADRCGMEGPRMCYLEAGDAAAPPTVLLHGIGSNATGWRLVIEGLKLRSRVIAWNAPGYYLSEGLLADAPRIEQYADALACFLDALQIETAAIAGSSFGGLIGIVFAARHPARVKRLAVFGAARGTGHLPDEERMRRLAARESLVQERGGMGLAEARWRDLLGPHPTDLAVALAQDILRATHRRGFIQSVRASSAADATRFAVSVRSPTLVVVGTEDRVNPPEVSRAIVRAITGAQLVTLEGVGHLSKLEAPDRVVALLNEFFGAEQA